MSIFAITGLAPVNLTLPVIVAPACAASPPRVIPAIPSAPTAIAAIHPAVRIAVSSERARALYPGALLSLSDGQESESERQHHRQRRQDDHPRRRRLVQGQEIPGGHGNPVAPFTVGTVPGEERDRNRGARAELKLSRGVTGRKGAGEDDAPLPVVPHRLGRRRRRGRERIEALE